MSFAKQDMFKNSRFLDGNFYRFIFTPQMKQQWKQSLNDVLISKAIQRKRLRIQAVSAKCADKILTPSSFKAPNLTPIAMLKGRKRARVFTSLPSALDTAKSVASLFPVGLFEPAVNVFI